jgi:hypothetical protein
MAIFFRRASFAPRSICSASSRYVQSPMNCPISNQGSLGLAVPTKSSSGEHCHTYSTSVQRTAFCVRASRRAVRGSARPDTCVWLSSACIRPRFHGDDTCWLGRSRRSSSFGTSPLRRHPRLAASTLPSLRAQRSNPGATARGPWIASSQGLLAITANGVFNHGRSGARSPCIDR